MIWKSASKMKGPFDHEMCVLMFGKLVQPEIEKMIAARNFDRLRELLLGSHPADIAELMLHVSQSNQDTIFRLLPRKLAADAFAYMDHDHQEGLIQTMGQREIAVLLNEMSDDDRTALLGALPGDMTAALIQLLTPDTASLPDRC